MCRLDLPDSWADIVTGSYALRNAPVLGDALAEVRRVLKPGGTAAFLDFRKSPRPPAAAFKLPCCATGAASAESLSMARPEHSYIAESLWLFPDAVRLAACPGAGFEITRARA